MVGKEIVAALGEPLEKGGQTFLVRSADGGTTWSRKKVLWMGEMALCSEGGKLWRVSGLGRIVAE
jgi:hypothetical protein